MTLSVWLWNKKGWVLKMQLRERAKLLNSQADRYMQDLDQAAQFLAARGINRQAAVIARLGVVTAQNAASEHEQQVGRLVIPYCVRAGVSQLRFRTLDGSEPKYLGLPGVQPALFQTEALSAPGETIVITEGELDALVLYRLCGVPAVGVPGAQAFKKHWWRLFRDFQNVVVMTDGDAAGRELAVRLASSIRDARVITLPDGMDVNDFYMAHGPDALREKVNGSE